MIFKRDSIYRMVCHIKTPKNEKEFKIGTGIFVGRVNNFYLLTAAHVAYDTNGDSIIYTGDENSNCITIPLLDIVKCPNWKIHPIADMAVIELNIEKLNPEFQDRVFPFDHINISEQCASKDDELTVFGFPQGLGVQEKFDPLTFRTHAASSFLSWPRADNSAIVSNFFCLENPSIEGYSGAPVLDLGYITMGSIIPTKDKTVLHGIIHGTIGDCSGGKLALVTPAYYLRDLI